MFGLGKKNNEWLPWYRRKGYDGNMTEAEKRELDAFRTQEKHPAATTDDLPEEVQSYISGMEIELMDLRRDMALYKALSITFAFGGALYAAYKGWFEPYFEVPFYITTPIIIIISWINYGRETARISDEFFPKGDDAPVTGTDEAIRREWELQYTSYSRGHKLNS